MKKYLLFLPVLLWLALQFVYVVARGLPALILAHRAMKRRDELFRKFDEEHGIQSFSE